MKYPAIIRCQCEIAVACGLSFSEAGRALGVNKSTARFWLRPEAYAHNKKRAKERYMENPEKERLRSRQWKNNNPEKVKQASQAWKRANRERTRASAASWARNNREKLNKLRKEYYWQNPEKARAVARYFYRVHSEKRKEYRKQHYESNRQIYIENARRRQQKYRAFPMTEIEKMMCKNYYLIARELTEQTGIKHEVDHIWPISKGGPHLPWNLQVLTKEENRKKSNKI
jgi:5-methylcytosine-specific restriction endonuclease McrA